MQKSLAVSYLFPNADPTRDFIIQDDGKGQYIAAWNLKAPEPTDAELKAAWAALQASEATKVPELTDVEKLQQENVLLKAQNAALTERADFIEDVIAEMAMALYQ